MPDLRFERRGHDLFCNHSIDVLDLIVGTNIEFNTISGKKLNVTIKAKTQPFMQVKLAGQGMPVPNSNLYGDQYVLLKPYISDNIDSEIVDTILRNRIK
jgi:DnaJ-class molecular chaperone